jgi:hypothetical protein
MKQTYFTNKQDSIFQAVYDVLTEGKYIQEANGGSDPDITAWTKKGAHNYDSFLSSNEDRIGKPMIDGGLAATHKKAASINGQPNDDLIYCGSGCVAYMRGNIKIFIKLPSGLINTGDGTTPWSSNKNYDSDGVFVEGKTSAEFRAYAAALAVAAKV